MKILQIGAPKSGNFWLYKIIQGILKKSGHHQRSYIQQHPIYLLAQKWELNYPEQADIDMVDITNLQSSYRISSIFRMPIDSMADYVAKTNHVWSHSPICNSSGDVFKYFDKKVYIVRDPRDRAISASNYFCSPYMLKYFPQPITDPKEYLRVHFDRLVKEWVWHVFDHLRYGQEFNIKILYYENFLMNFQQQLETLLAYLSLSLSPTDKQELEKETAFSSMKKDNPKHLKKGTFGYWQEQLNTEQMEKAAVIAGPLLDALGYDKVAEQVALSVDHSQIDFELLKDEIIVSQGNIKSPNS